VCAEIKKGRLVSGLFCFDMQGTSMQGNNPGGRGLESLIAALACCAALLCYGVLRRAEAKANC